MWHKFGEQVLFCLIFSVRKQTQWISSTCQWWCGWFVVETWLRSRDSILIPKTELFPVRLEYLNKSRFIELLSRWNLAIWGKGVHFARHWPPSSLAWGCLGRAMWHITLWLLVLVVGFLIPKVIYCYYCHMGRFGPHSWPVVKEVRVWWL